MQGSAFLAAQLARRAYLDGFEEGLNGMLAVCHTFRNRVRSGWWGGDWSKVLSDHKTSSYKIEPDPDTVPDPRIYSFQCLLQEIDGIFSGQTPDNITIAQQTVLATPAPVALYYARLDRITSEHFLEEIARKPEIHQRVAQVGMLTFIS